MASPRLSIFTDSKMSYPADGEGYSPDERYPESPFDRLTATENLVYRAVRKTLAMAGLDRDRFDTPRWNPLGRYIPRGSNVFVLCNFVHHRRPGESQEAFWSKCTHAAVVRAVIDYVIIAAGRNAKIAFGNAPVYGCEWNQVLQATGADQIVRFYDSEGCGVEATDLRHYVQHASVLGWSKGQEQRDARGCQEVVLGPESLLDGLGSTRFRVRDYDPKETERHHGVGMHRYALNRRALEADVIVSVPKLKVHEKVGVTCAIKGVVGTVADKSCLAHHRAGAPSRGGDEYPRQSLLAGLASRLHEWVYRDHQRSLTRDMLVFLDRNLGRVQRRAGVPGAGAWYGNDTAWRMACDLARIVRYADRHGQMCEEAQRRHIALIDGVIGGEGQGPLSPSPARTGTLVFSDDVAVADWAACRLMGYDPHTIPIVHNGFRKTRYPISSVDPAKVDAIHNERQVPLNQIPPVLGRSFALPKGWQEGVGLVK